MKKPVNKGFSPFESPLWQQNGNIIWIIVKVKSYQIFWKSEGSFSFLLDIKRQAEDMFFRIVKQLAEKENITEKLKAENQMLWVQKMNNIRNRATEIVNAELIYTV